MINLKKASKAEAVEAVVKSNYSDCYDFTNDILEMISKKYILISFNEYTMNLYNPFISEIVKYLNNYFVLKSEVKLLISNDTLEAVVKRNNTVYLLKYNNDINSIQISVLSHTIKVTQYNF
jgi:hypothetical protein